MPPMDYEARCRQAQIDEVRENGFCRVSGLVSAAQVRHLNTVARSQLADPSAPLEYEADLHYPGAPADRQTEGGDTVRRLLDAYGRDASFADWASAGALRAWLRDYFGESVSMSRAHHNCLMTKHPRFGSLTGWHRDFRYWSFARDDLLSVWLALGEESNHNGGLWLVPGSQRLPLDAGRFDRAKFFRGDLAENRALLATAIAPQLVPGDALFFHCNTLHSAGQNLSDTVKFSLVFTYHAASNQPTPGTRSDSLPEVRLA